MRLPTLQYRAQQGRTIMSSIQQIPVHQLETVLNPIHEATGLGNEFYTEQRYFELERDQVMGKTWACVGFASDLG